VKNGNFEEYPSNRSQITQKTLHSSSGKLALIINPAKLTLLANGRKVTDKNLQQNLCN
jgi:hypothetical protein